MKQFSVAELLTGMLRGADQRLGLFSPHGAALYARLGPRFNRPLYERVIVDVEALRPLDVLDVGSGPGTLAVALAARLPAARVVGIDVTRSMVDAARRAAALSELVDRVTFVHGDASAMPFPAESFDLVVSTLSLHHWREPVGVFAEIRRTLRPGATALLYDPRVVAYSRRELHRLAAPGLVVEGHELVRTGRLPLPYYVRVMLRRA